MNFEPMEYKEYHLSLKMFDTNLEGDKSAKETESLVTPFRDT